MQIFTVENTRDLVLRAAMVRFTNYGYKRTSLEDIANEANLSRPTIYAYFKNKKTILRSVSQGIHDVTLANIEIALNLDATLEQRLLQCFNAWTEPYKSILFGTPHGAELIGASSLLASDISTKASERFHSLLSECLKQAQLSGDVDLTVVNLTASRAAQFMILSLNGLSSVDTDEKTNRQNLHTLINVFLTACRHKKGN